MSVTIIIRYVLSHIWIIISTTGKSVIFIVNATKLVFFNLKLVFYYLTLRKHYLGLKLLFLNRFSKCIEKRKQMPSAYITTNSPKFRLQIQLTYKINKIGLKKLPRGMTYPLCFHFQNIIYQNNLCLII